jgi:lysyl-tRNA synthetase class 2
MGDEALDEPADQASEQVVRLAKLEALREAGGDPYPYRFDRSHTLAEVGAEHATLAAGTETDVRVAVAGRLMLVRRQGKLTFATLRDRTGELQLFVSRSVLGEAGHEAFDALDRGDWIGVEGTVMVTRKGELSVKVDRFELLAKALRPLPEKWKGLTDTDTRYRQRYTDLIVNDEARRVFEVRHALVASFRRTLAEHGFIEVETPILHLEAGGAHARPFTTHHNTLDLDLHLRIALELHLKRLIVAGMERVFEIGRVFRNEGLSTRHNPEFTMLELYQAFGDYSDVMAITETLIVQAARDALGATEVAVGEERVDLARPWPRARMVDLASEALGMEVHPSQPVERLRDAANARAVSWQPHWGSGKIIEELFEATVEDDLTGPMFVTGHPVEISPLARVDRHDPYLTERFELYVGGRELANGYSELNDPIEQRQRFEDEQRAKDAGDLGAGSVDEDYLRALEYGMPPTGGLGIGIDRVAMLLAGVTTIKEVILFPTLRPEAF